MNPYPSKVVAIAALTAVAGCATGPDIRGETTASPQLRADTVKAVSIYATAATQCERVDSINVQTLHVDPDVRGDSSGEVISGNIEERWTASLCGQEAPFLVTFIPDGRGGSVIRVRPDKKQ